METANFYSAALISIVIIISTLGFIGYLIIPRIVENKLVDIILEPVKEKRMAKRYCRSLARLEDLKVAEHEPVDNLFDFSDTDHDIKIDKSIYDVSEQELLDMMRDLAEFEEKEYEAWVAAHEEDEYQTWLITLDKDNSKK
jgi:hypothetical protein